MVLTFKTSSIKHIIITTHKAIQALNPVLMVRALHVRGPEPAHLQAGGAGFPFLSLQLYVQQDKYHVLVYKDI